MRIDENDKRHVFADDGKTLRHKCNGAIFGEEIILGSTYYTDECVMTDTLRDDTVDMYEEIDKPIESENNFEENSEENGQFETV